MTFLDELRERPEEERLAFAGLAAGAVILVLFLVWGIFFFGSDRTTAFVEVDAQQASVLESLEGAGSDFRAATQELGRSVDELRELQQAVELSVDGDGNVIVDDVIIPRDTFNEAR